MDVSFSSSLFALAQLNLPEDSTVPNEYTGPPAIDIGHFCSTWETENKGVEGPLTNPVLMLFNS